MKSMCKHWGLHISTNINCLGAVLGSFWAVWKGLFWCLKAKLRLWLFPRYWRFNERYHGGYQLICLISRPLLIASRRDWYRSKGLLKGFKLALRPWESSKNWWRYDRMKFVTCTVAHSVPHCWGMYFTQQTSCLPYSLLIYNTWYIGIYIVDTLLYSLCFTNCIIPFLSQLSSHLQVFTWVLQPELYLKVITFPLKLASLP